MTHPLITEDSQKNDISTVFATLVKEEPPPPGSHPRAQPNRCDVFSCFNGQYELGNERKFIAELEAKNPGRYARYSITYSDCN
jgi:hypothetical protein